LSWGRQSKGKYKGKRERSLLTIEKEAKYHWSMSRGWGKEGGELIQSKTVKQ
jgi:hypothetical protein